MVIADFFTEETKGMIRVSQPVTDQAEIDAIAEAMKLAYFGHGTKVVEFEQPLRAFFGNPECQSALKIDPV